LGFKSFSFVSCSNSGDHGILKPPTELEMMMTIAQTYELQLQGQKDLKTAVAQAASSMPPCKGYIKSIGDFVGSVAGGETFKLLKYLDFVGALAAWISTEEAQFSSSFSKLLFSSCKLNFQSLCKLLHLAFTSLWSQSLCKLQLCFSFSPAEADPMVQVFWWEKSSATWWLTLIG